MRSLNPWPIFPHDLDLSTKRHLSLCFLLETLIRGFEDLLIFKKMVEKELKGENLDMELAIITKGFERLFLLSLENPFAQKGGALDKLCFYSEILLQSSKNLNSDLFDLLEEIRKIIFSKKIKIISWKNPYFQYSLNGIRQTIHEIIESFHQFLTRFFYALLPFFREERMNENVLSFFIENKETLNKHLGTGKIESVLQSLFPSGYHQLKACVEEKYIRRGFSQYLQNLAPMLDAIEWEANRQCQYPKKL